MPELALYDQERDPLAGHLDSVGVPELVLVPTSAQPPLKVPAWVVLMTSAKARF